MTEMEKQEADGYLDGSWLNKTWLCSLVCGGVSTGFGGFRL